MPGSSSTHSLGPLEARATFDEVASLYDSLRPGYPEELFHDLVALAHLTPPARLLEIGPGTGHATLGLARLGFRIDGVELGEHMAEVARQNLADFPSVAITVADFDHWSTNTRYDLVFSASAYHWLDPATRVSHIAALLKAEGAVAIWRNYHVCGAPSRDFHIALQQVYQQVAPELAEDVLGLSDTAALPQPEPGEWLASGLFAPAQTRSYRWQKRYTTREYIGMLDTHSDHRLLSSPVRARLFERLADLIRTRFHGEVMREYATLLHVARRRHQDAMTAALP